MPEIPLECENCYKRIIYDVNAVNRTFSCPFCGHNLSIPFFDFMQPVDAKQIIICEISKIKTILRARDEIIHFDPVCGLLIMREERAGYAHGKIEEIMQLPEVFRANEYHNLGYFHLSVGDSLSALEFHKKSLKRRHIDGLPLPICADLASLALVYLERNNPEEAVKYYIQALNTLDEFKICDKKSDTFFTKRAKGAIVGSLGIAYFKCGDLQMAIDTLGKTTESRRETQDLFGEAKDLWFMALVVKRLKPKSDEAILIAESALDVIARTEDRTQPSHNIFSSGAGESKSFYSKYYPLIKSEIMKWRTMHEAV